MRKVAQRIRVSLFKKRGKIWYARYRFKGKRCAQSLRATTHREALDLAASLEDQLNAPAGAVEIQEGIEYGELIKLFLEYKAGQGRADSTLVGYVNHLNNFGRFLGKDFPVEAIQPAHLEDYPAARRKEINRNVKRRDDNGEFFIQRHPTTKTIREELISLSTLFKWAERRGYLAVNPARNVELPKVPKKLPRYLTYAQYRHFHKSIDDELFKDIVDFYIMTGMRRAEGIMLRSHLHVDLERALLTIPQPKQGDFRQLPISPRLLVILKRLMLRAGEKGVLVPYHEDTLTKMFHEYAVKAEMPGNFSFHVLRHTFGTWLGERGLSFMEIQALMGHSDPESTRKYVHAFTPNLAAAIAKLDLPDPEASGDGNHGHQMDTTSCHSMRSMHTEGGESAENLLE
jgi:integrase